MKSRDRRILKKFKKNLDARLDKTKPLPDHGERPVLRGSNVRYEMAERVRGVANGGIAAIHEMVRASGLADKLDEGVRLFKVHNPYYESDHILALAYNILNGGTCVEDLERCREDENFLNALGAARVPDPTTAADFLRRFDAKSVEALMGIVNTLRRVFWRKGLSADQRKVARIDVDGTISATHGETKQGMDIAYNGLWGYAPLLVSLANTKEPLFIVNRPGNAPSSLGAADYIDRAIELVLTEFDRVELAGDTDFSQTKYLDGWDSTGRVRFYFGYDARSNLIEISQSLQPSCWSRLGRPQRYEVKTKRRQRPENVKERIVEERGYDNIRLLYEDVAEFEYRPQACKKSYRMIVLRKTVEVVRGQGTLFSEEERYFFYITNDRDLTPAQIVRRCNQRCDQENLISQLKSQVHALAASSNTLESNWAWMVIASLAWTFKSWYALLIPNETQRHATLRMEFKRFLNLFIHIPCQVVQTGRQLVLRVMGFKHSLETFFETWDVIRRLWMLRI